MSELPKCIICAVEPIKSEAKGWIFHPVLPGQKCPLRDSGYFTPEQWTKLMGQSEPAAWEFQHEETGLIDFVDPQQVEWGFEKINPRWQKIGPVYRHPCAAPPQAQGDDAQCAARYRWLRDNRHLGAWFSAGFSHLEYGQNIDADIDEAMIEDVARKAGV